MPTLIRSVLKMSTALAGVLASALLASACSSAPPVEPLGGSAQASSPTMSQSTSPNPITLPGNGGLVFSQATLPSGDGLPLDAVVREVDVHGAVGPVLVRGAVYRAAPSWAPDGRAFAFLDGHGISVRRGHDTQLIVACHPQTCSGLGAPSWSPSGSSIAFSGEIDGEEGLFQASPDGGEPSSIVTSIAIRGAPSWSPEGDRLAAIVAEGGTASLQLLDAETGQVQRSVDLPGLEPGGTVAWSPDGSQLAFEAVGSDRGDHQGIYVLGLAGSDAQLLTACPDEGCTDLGPSFSPDGAWVVFTRARCDEPGSDCFVGDVWVIEVDGGEAHALTQGPGLDCCAAWRPIPS